MCEFLKNFLFLFIYLFNLFFVYYLIFELQNTVSVFTALQAAEHNSIDLEVFNPLLLHYG